MFDLKKKIVSSITLIKYTYDCGQIKVNNILHIRHTKRQGRIHFKARGVCVCVLVITLFACVRCVSVTHVCVCACVTLMCDILTALACWLVGVRGGKCGGRRGRRGRQPRADHVLSKLILSGFRHFLATLTPVPRIHPHISELERQTNP